MIICLSATFPPIENISLRDINVCKSPIWLHIWVLSEMWFYSLWSNGHMLHPPCQHVSLVTSRHGEERSVCQNTSQRAAREEMRKAGEGKNGWKQKGHVRSIIKGVTDSCSSYHMAPRASPPSTLSLTLAPVRSGTKSGGWLSDSFNNANYSGLKGPVMLSGDSTHCGARATVLDEGRHQSATAGPHSSKHTHRRMHTHQHTHKYIQGFSKTFVHSRGFTLWTEHTFFFM